MRRVARLLGLVGILAALVAPPLPASAYDEGWTAFEANYPQAYTARSSAPDVLALGGTGTSASANKDTFRVSVSATSRSSGPTGVRTSPVGVGGATAQATAGIRQVMRLYSLESSFSVSIYLDDLATNYSVNSYGYGAYSQSYVRVAAYFAWVKCEYGYGGGYYGETCYVDYSRAPEYRYQDVSCAPNPAGSCIYSPDGVTLSATLAWPSECTSGGLIQCKGVYVDASVYAAAYGQGSGNASARAGGDISGIYGGYY